MVKSVLQIECGITLNVDVDAKNQKKCVQKCLYLES